MPSLTFDSPLGPLTVIERDGAIAELRFGEGVTEDATTLLQAAANQVIEYFAGERKDFDLPFAAPATPFQVAMRQAMLDIPFGLTRTYGDIAKAIGMPPQAVGQGCGKNTIPIIVPCHRVVAAGGKLGGFSGGDGAPTKRWLLAHEAHDDLFAAYR
jgi:methylated-DNA-[protein]-cysteine S-methyltransferase